MIISMVGKYSHHWPRSGTLLRRQQSICDMIAFISQLGLGFEGDFSFSLCDPSSPVGRAGSFLPIL